MADFIEWCSFLGAWLLVAGALFQAILELREQDLRRDEMIELSTTLPKVEPVSAWWWILPPLHLWLQRRRNEASRQRLLNQLSDEAMEGLLTFMNKARGWFIVGSGGLLLAVAETWGLTEKYGWRTWIFWVVILVMASACVLNAVGMIARTQKVRKHHHNKAA
ncbi:hypothetical protein SAMN05444157_0571 [Frankineae bacterium MT45]|nr:hypothetical protein SAMN05444157_0571 [Frankineae bacterium MT45]